MSVYHSTKSPYVETVCLTCGSIFQVKQNQLARGGGRYCSKKCRYSSPIISESISKKAKERWATEDGRNRYVESYRQRSESEAWRSAPHFQSGENHPRYRGGKKLRNQEMARYPYKKWRTDVFKRDNYTCQDCGKRGGNLIAHHIQQWADHPELRYVVSNGITLCAMCHDQKHGLHRRPKTYHCVECGGKKKDPRGVLCRKCAAHRGGQAYAKKRMKVYICPVCQCEFKPRKTSAVFCSNQCRIIGQRGKKKAKRMTDMGLSPQLVSQAEGRRG